MAFKILDADGSGVVDLNDIKAKYSAKQHPDVLQGRKTEDEVLLEFLDTFDGGLRCEVLETSKMQEMLWRKLIVNAAINPLASLLDAPNRSIVSSEGSQQCVAMVVREALAVAQCEQIPLTCSQEELVKDILEVAHNTSTNRLMTGGDQRKIAISEVKDDLGIAAGNVEAIRANLQAQGINDIQSISTTGNVQAESDANKRSNDSFHPQVTRKKQHGAGASSIIFG
eukprot:jgi/Phyca11/533185/estExt2_fgenesh1_pg.C_PHYCAscaffold_110062